MIRIAILLAAVAAAAAPAFAQQRGAWLADARTGCAVWDQDPPPGSTLTWSGACEGGKAQGRGVAQWLRHGRPTDSYVGDMRDGRFEGRGVWTSADGTYDGEYRAGRWNGRGVLTTARGSRYEGEFRDDAFHGRGVLLVADGGRYDGDWAFGRPNGYGVYTRPGAPPFAGNWTQGCFRDGDRIAHVATTREACGF